MLLINTKCTKLFVLELLELRPNQKEEVLFAILCVFLESTVPKVPPSDFVWGHTAEATPSYT